MTLAARFRSTFVLSLLLLAACTGALMRPPYVAQRTSALVPVRFPPPPARGEYVPERPAKGAVWIDGEWTWRGDEWAWKPGRWVTVPSGAAFSPWVLVRGVDGTVYVASGRWFLPDGGEVEEPSPLAAARVVGGAVVDPWGRVELTGIVRPSFVADAGGALKRPPE